MNNQQQPHIVIDLSKYPPGYQQGMEIGILWERMTQGIVTIEFSISKINEDVVKKMCEGFHYSYRFDEVSWRPDMLNLHAVKFFDMN